MCTCIFSGDYINFTFIKTNLLILTICLSLFGCQQNQDESEVPDPYLWLEEIEGKESLEWIKAKNKESELVINRHPLFESLKARFLETFNDKD